MMKTSALLAAVLLLASVLYTDAQLFRRRPRPNRNFNRRPAGCPQNNKRLALPQSWQIELALNNDKVIADAIKCIRSPNPVCPGLPYGSKLKQVAPDLILLGSCHPCICTPKEAADAQKLIRKIAVKFPNEFAELYHELSKQRQGR